MIDIIIDVLIDSLKILPFLLVAFLIIEIIEHKLSDKGKTIISKNKKYGFLLGSILGVIPQCGFSVMATNLYVTRIISLGTLISIYLSTSDEMLPILISNQESASLILKVILCKVIVGLVVGFIIDFILRKKENRKDITNYEICDEDHCHCEKGIFKSSLIHTLKTLLFVILISFIISILFEYFGNNFLSKLFLKNSLLSPFITSLIGLIPNCASSVIITELFLNNAISFSGMIAGLLTGSGVAILILFKTNKNIKENLFITAIIYFTGVLFGILFEVLELLF